MSSHLREHGHGQDGPEPGYPLALATAGECVRVVTITADPASESRLVSMGINPGAMLRIISASGGPIVVARDETRYGIDRRISWHIRVVPTSPEMGGFRRDPCNGNCRGCSYSQGAFSGMDFSGSVSLDRLPPGTSGTISGIRGVGWRRRTVESEGISIGERITMKGAGSGTGSVSVETGGTTLELSRWDALHVMVRTDP
jgi:Fe2+ transport system protein FeoA